ncbi:MAG: DUF1858 domain-containing protein [Acidobacteriota bacterium]|nr:MAG: DUF1858 domain-containing protein [Acidobacteriota bacterium]
MKEITPEMKVAELLESYPSLEQTLIELSPSFRKLQNPVLRNTVARVTTLGQAARVGGVPLGDLINRLRGAAGQAGTYQVEAAEDSLTSEEPPWMTESRAAHQIDVRPILERGEKPIATVLAALNNLESGQTLELTAPLLPAPLIDTAKSRGLETYVRKEGPELFRVYFHKPV